MPYPIYYFLRQNGRAPVEEYLLSLDDKRQLAAILKSIDRLHHFGRELPMPFAKHVQGKIWELRTMSGSRVFYFILTNEEIILLDGYTKKRDRIEHYILNRVINHYQEYLVTSNRKAFYATS